MKALVCLVIAAAFAALPLSALPPASPPALPREIHISYAKSPFNLPLIVAARRGMFEEAFAAKGVAVKFFEIDSGAKQAEALASGSLDIAGVINSTSVILAAAGGNELKIISGFSRPTGLFAIVVKDPAIRTIADLKGKKVAGPKGTVLHQLLAAALARSGLSMSDVAFLQMDIPPARAALLAGQVDAALLAAANVSSAVAAGARVLTTAEGYVKPQLFVAARSAFLRDYPELVELYVSVHRSALAWIAAHEEEALALGAKEQGISLDEARSLASASHFTDSVGREGVAAMAEDVQFMLGAGMLSSLVDPSKLLAPQLAP
jgi:sulfonate transport system substrate-binding protein